MLLFLYVLEPYFELVSLEHAFISRILGYFTERLVNFTIYSLNQSTNFKIFSLNWSMNFTIIFHIIGDMGNLQICPFDLMVKLAGFFFFFHATAEKIFQFFFFPMTNWQILRYYPTTKWLNLQIFSPAVDWQISWFFSLWLSNFTFFFVTNWQILPFHIAADWQNSQNFSHVQLKNFTIIFFFLRWVN